MKTLSMVPPPVSPVVPAMPPPVPWGSMTNPRTVVLSSRSTTSALLSVSVGRLAATAVHSVSAPTTRLAASLVSTWLAFRLMPAA